MRIELAFIGKARAIAEFYESGGETHFDVVPNAGDLIRMRMHPGPDVRTFRCTARRFDFSESAKGVLRLDLDME